MSMITKKELADMYNVSRNTISKRLAELGIKTRKRLTPLQVEHVYEELGHPEKLRGLSLPVRE